MSNTNQDPSIVPYYTCDACDNIIPSPGVGHDPKCCHMGKDYDTLTFHPAACVVHTDDNGVDHYYANLQGGYQVTRRVDKP